MHNFTTVWFKYTGWQNVLITCYGCKCVRRALRYAFRLFSEWRLYFYSRYFCHTISQEETTRYVFFHFKADNLLVIINLWKKKIIPSGSGGGGTRSWSRETWLKDGTQGLIQDYVNPASVPWDCQARIHYSVTRLRICS